MLVERLITSDLLSPVFALVDQGGSVIWLLLLLALLLWLLMFERFMPLYLVLPKHIQQHYVYWCQSDTATVLNSAKGDANSRVDGCAWQQAQLNQAFSADIFSISQQGLSLIKTLIGVCPLLGLLGTVTGMMAVFDVIAVTGTSDAKAMAGGIFQATLPTMCGLFLALSALYFHYLLVRQAEKIQLQAQEMCHGG